MKGFRKKIYLGAGYNTIYMGPGRKEFDPAKPMKSFDQYLKGRRGHRPSNPQPCL